LVVVYSFLLLVLNLIVDLAYLLLDPRIKYE
jgi:ABC-type dipeptide/oligopeptide/nickel transport system permease component